MRATTLERILAENNTNLLAVVKHQVMQEAFNLKYCPQLTTPFNNSI